MESTAEVWAAVSLVLTSASGLSLGCILAALAPHTELFTTALCILSAGLRKVAFEQTANNSAGSPSPNTDALKEHAPPL